MIVIKVGGNELDDDSFMGRLAEAVSDLADKVIIVHGGGQAIADMQKRLGLTPKKVDGLRVTDEASLAIDQMVLSGDINKKIVRALLARHVPAIGISGVDGGLLRCEKKSYKGEDLGKVGAIVAVKRDLLDTLLGQGFTPVVSPISIGLDGTTYNVNADEAAGAIASEMRAKRVWFISNVHAVLGADNQPINSLTAQQAAALMNEGIIRNGMVPKVQTALNTVRSGVPEAIIAGIEGLVMDSGTRFTASPASAGMTASPTEKES